MRVRLRPALTPAVLAETYATPHDHRRWGDHVVRVKRTVAFAREHVGPVAVGADLSCGSGAVLAGMDVGTRHFGDLAPGYAITGPIGSTIDDIPDVDVFVCCETLEHLDDPDAVLKAVRAKTRTLVLSTPVEAWADANPEHYWAWSRPDVEEMLAAAGFVVVAHDVVDLRAEGPDFYAFGLWVAR